MPTNSIEGIALYYRSENGTFKKLSRIDGNETFLGDDTTQEDPVVFGILSPFETTIKIRMPWYKNNHLAEYGKNRRIREKNKKLAKKRFESIFFN